MVRGAFNRYSLADTPYIRQYQGMPLEEVDTLGNVMQQRYDFANEYYDKLNTAASQINVLDEDAAIKQRQLDDIRNSIEVAAERGDAWEDMLPTLRQKARAFTSNDVLKQAQANREKKAAWQNELLERRNKGDITDLQYRYAIANSRFKGTEIVEGDEDYIEGGPNMRSFSGYNPTNFFDLNKFSDEFLENYKSDTYTNGIQKVIDPDTGLVEYYVHGTTEQIKAEDIAKDLSLALGSNRKAMDYVMEQSKITGVSPEQIITGLITPYANKGAMIDQDLKYMKGEAGTYRAGKKKDEDDRQGSMAMQTTASPFKSEKIDIGAWSTAGETAEILATPFKVPAYLNASERNEKLGNNASALDRFIAYNKSSNPQLATALEDIVESNPKEKGMTDEQYASRVSEIYNARAEMLANFNGQMESAGSADNQKDATKRYLGYLDKSGTVKLGEAALGGAFYYQDQEGNPAKATSLQEIAEEMDMSLEDLIGNANYNGKYKENPFTGGDGHVFSVRKGDEVKQVVLGTSTVENSEGWKAVKQLVTPKYSPNTWETVAKVPTKQGLKEVKSTAIEVWADEAGNTISISKGMAIPKEYNKLVGRDISLQVKDEDGEWVSTYIDSKGNERILSSTWLYNFTKNQQQ